MGKLFNELGPLSRTVPAAVCAFSGVTVPETKHQWRLWNWSIVESGANAVDAG